MKMKMIKLSKVVAEHSDDLEMPREASIPVTIMDPERTVRDFSPRHGENRTGTRIVFQNGSAYPVTELYDDVVAKFASLSQ
jgi:hypothetical protein